MTERSRKILATVLLASAVALVAVGAFVSYGIEPAEGLRPEKPASDVPPGFVSDPFANPGGFGPTGFDPGAMPTPPPTPKPPIPEQVSDLELVVNATYTGVIKRGGELLWRVDPTEDRGKRACPT